MTTGEQHDDPAPSTESDGPIDLEGQHDHGVDDKGRVSIPAAFRGALALSSGDEVVITRHLKDRCLRIYTGEAWTRFKVQVEADRSPVGNVLRRVVKGSARTARLDRLGRVLLPGALRQYARLDGRCFVVGQGHCMEVWDVDVWAETHDPDRYADLDLSDYDM
ncbi:MAG: division/cell wall cluster transcriptional repressor MraZ [Bradymonadia bacterium]